MSQPAAPSPEENPRPRPSPGAGADQAAPSVDEAEPWWYEPRWRWLLAAAAAVIVVGVALFVVLGGGDSPQRPGPSASSAAPHTGGVGETLDLTTPEGTGRLTLTSAGRLVGSDFAQPPAHGSYLVITVTLQVDGGAVAAGPFQWQAQDPQGSVYPAVPAGLTGNDMDSAEVTAGHRTTGEIAFDVPTGPLTVTLASPSGHPLAVFDVPAEP
jgi:hypothetical protein